MSNIKTKTNLKKRTKKPKLIIPPYVPTRGWYIIQTKFNNEEQVYKLLKSKVLNLDLQSTIFNILLPKRDIFTTNKQGKIVSKSEWIYRQYIYIEMIPTTNTLYQIRQTTGVINILGADVNEPQQVSKNGMDTLFLQLGLSDDQFNVNDEVKIVDGLFKDSTGVITSINKQNITISLNNNPISIQTTNQSIIRV